MYVSAQYENISHFPGAIYQAANLDHLNCTDLLIADPAPTMETTKKSDPLSNTMDDYHLGSKLT